MKFAVKNGNRIKAELSGDIAQCICCGLPVRAYIKDHERKVRLRDFNNQWKHINNMCDKWWESETEWHRRWKDNFPNHWQEFVMVDRLTGEKHIADVFTIGRNEEVIIEFQNSKISEREVKSREEFYKKMIWVVNASSFGIILGGYADRENEGNELLNEYWDLKKFINSFYDSNSGEAASYKESTVPFNHIDFEKCINVIQWYSEYRGWSGDIKFQEEFEKFKLAILEYPILEKRLDESKNKITEKGYFYYHCKGSDFWAMAKAPVFFDIDGNLYRIIPEEGDKKFDVTDDDIELEYSDDNEWDDIDEFSEGGMLKKYSHEQFIYHYRNSHTTKVNSSTNI